MENSLKHFNIKGSHWGIRRWQNKDGSLTPAGRIRYGKDKKRQKQEVDSEEAKRQREEAKQKAIKSGTATELKKFRGELDARELQTAIDRLDKEQKIRELSADELKGHKTKTEKFFNKVDKGVKYAEVSIKAYNTIANVRNAFTSSSKKWPKVSTSIADGGGNKNKKDKKD